MIALACASLVCDARTDLHLPPKCTAVVVPGPGDCASVALKIENAVIHIGIWRNKACAIAAGIQALSFLRETSASTQNAVKGAFSRGAHARALITPADATMIVRVRLCFS